MLFDSTPRSGAAAPCRVAARLLPLSLLGLAVLVSAAVPPAFAQTAAAATSTTVTPAAAVAAAQTSAQQIAKGVRLLQTVVPANAPGGPLLVTAIEADPKVAGVRIEAALGQDRVWGTDPSRGRESVPSLVKRHGAVAGINACFFPFTGVPIGLHVQGGELVTEPSGRNSVFWIGKDGKAHIDALSYSGTVQASTGESLPLDGLNRPATPKKGDAKPETFLLYTGRYFDATPTNPDRVDALLRISDANAALVSGKPVQATILRTSEGGAMPLTPGTVVLSGGGDGAALLRKLAATPGATLTLNLNVVTRSGKPFDVSQVREAVTGRPRLLARGEVRIPLQAEGVDSSFSTTHHPRSAVGIKADGKILLLTVDGRQKSVSGGIALNDLAELMKSMGCVDAMNLDGGGSSELSVGGSVVNSPSEAPYRPDASMLLVYGIPLSTATPSAAWTAAPPTVTVGDTVSLPARNPKTAVWGVDSGIGWISQGDGIFHALRPGAGTVSLMLPGNSAPAASLPITVVGKTTLEKGGFQPKLTLTPDPSNPNRATLAIHIANAEGDPLNNEPVAIAVTGGTATPATVTTAGRGDATATITWDPATPAAGRSVSVTSPAKRFDAGTVKP